MRTKIIARLIAIGCLITPHIALAQAVASSPAADKQAVRDADDAFWRAFNACDGATMATSFAEDVEFYHDITGLTRSRPAVVASLLKGPCGTPGLHLRRELVANSVRYQAIPWLRRYADGGPSLLYPPRQRARTAGHACPVLGNLEASVGALADDQDRKLRPPPGASFTASAEITIPAEILQRYVGRYRTGASGDIDIALANGALVLRSGGLRVGLGASAVDHFFAHERDLRVSFVSSPDVTTILIEENGAVVTRGQRVDAR